MMITASITNLHNTPHRAFTLIELLVVISIVSLLLAIMLPALASARDSAVRIRCLANVRGIGQSLLMASQDHKQVIPDMGNWGASNGPFGDVSTPQSSEPYRINRGARDYILHYGLTRENFYCPNNTAANKDAYWNPTTDSPFSGYTTVIGYQILGGRVGLQRKSIASTEIFQTGKDTNATWIKLVPPGKESVALNVESQPVYPEIVTDVFRFHTQNNAFDPISGHVSGPNPYTDGGGRYVKEGIGGSNIIKLDGSGFWRQRAELGLKTGSLGSGLSQLEYVGSGMTIRFWW